MSNNFSLILTLVFWVFVIVMCALAVLCIPGFMRNRSMERLAKKHGLEYQRTTRKRFSLWQPFAAAAERMRWRENILTGTLAGHRVEVFDECQIAGVWGISTFKTTYVHVDDAPHTPPHHFRSLLSAARVEKALSDIA